MPEITMRFTVRLSSEEVAEAITDYVGKLCGGELPPMSAASLHFHIDGDMPSSLRKVDYAEISSWKKPND